MTRNYDLEARRLAAVPRGISAKYGLYVERAEGAELWDADGRHYIDFAGGIGVLNVGHRHPRVLAAIAAQAQRFLHTCFHVASYEGYIELAERLNAVMPGPGPYKTMLFSTGAEANENAVKIARAFTRRPAVVAFSGGFHGRTLMTLTMTGKARPNKVGFGPLPPEVYHLPYPSPWHGVSEAVARAAVDDLFRVAVAPEQIAALIMEPVQGDGGFNIAPPSFLKFLRQLCDGHGILLIADEIQSGMARTGRMLAIEHSGIAADIVTLAKSLGGGLPISAVIARTGVADCVAPTAVPLN